MTIPTSAKSTEKEKQSTEPLVQNGINEVIACDANNEQIAFKPIVKNGKPILLSDAELGQVAAAAVAGRHHGRTHARMTPQEAMVMMINSRRAGQGPGRNGSAGTYVTTNARLSSLATMMIFLVAFLVLSTGILGGIFLFRQFTRSLDGTHHFYTRCSIPYLDPELDDELQVLSQTTHATNSENTQALQLSQAFQKQLDAKLKQILEDVNQGPIDKEKFSTLQEATSARLQHLIREMQRNSKASPKLNSMDHWMTTINEDDGTADDEEDDDDDDEGIDVVEPSFKARTKDNNKVTVDEGEEDDDEQEAEGDKVHEPSFAAIMDAFERQIRNQMKQFFEEDFDLDLSDEERYEKIEVPKGFSHSRPGRFIHDFQLNLTAIIDLENDRCFIIPLNRSRVLPPKSLFDLVSKMQKGYYDVDTEVVRETYRVLTPKLQSAAEFRSLGLFIGRECAPRSATYRLERIPQDNVVRTKRSTLASQEGLVFDEFAGSKISEIHITNIK